MSRRNPLILSILISMLTSLHAHALESDASEEIIIQSNSAEFDRKAGTAIYIGDVVAGDSVTVLGMDITVGGFQHF